MRLLDHTQTDQGYIIRIWLDEIAPDAIETYTWVPYKSDKSEWDFTEPQYRQQQVAQATALASQKLTQLNPEPTVLTADNAAIEAQQAALDSSNGE